MLETEVQTEKPIFIVACPRSGTTKLASMLNKHSQIASATETHYFNFVSKQGFDWKNFNIADLERLLDESRIEDFTKLAGIENIEILEQFSAISRDQRPSSLDVEKAKKKEIFDLLVKTFLKKKTKSRLCEKTPQHLQCVDEILELYPDAKIILIVRDGRDTVNSLLKMPWRPDGVVNNARFWIQYANLGMKAETSLVDHLDDLEKRSLLKIKYEDLLENSEDVLKGICKFINENYEEDMLTAGDEDEELLFSSWESNWKHKSKQDLDQTRVGAWARELSPDDQILLEWSLAPTLQKLGYEVRRPSLELRHYLQLLTAYTAITWRKIVRLISNIVN